MASSTDARSPVSGSVPPPIRALGKYQIERALGAGGMGTVYLAVDAELRRTVALKVLSTDKAANPQLVRRFKSEGQAAARLEHENIVKVFEAGEINGQLYIALEYIDGIDVQELVSKRGRLPVRRTVEIVTQVAGALQHAYERGIVHRDIKPSNLLIRKDGRVKLADMGLARAIDETVEAGITHAGMTVGTVDYISPEQGSDSKRADIRSDLYSLGCSWYHMLTGEVPYAEGTAVDRLRAHALATIPDPRRINDRIPAAVVAVLQRLMAKRPEARYQTPLELLDDLQQPTLLQHETGAADIAGLALADSESPPPSEDDFDDPAPSASEVDPRLRGKSRGKSPRRSAAEDSEEPDDSPADVSHVDERLRGKSRGKPGRPARRGAAETSSEATSKTDGRSKSKPVSRQKPDTRELPPRSERPEQFAVAQGGIDFDTVKLIGGGLLALCVVSAIGWAVYRAAQDSGPPLAPAGVNPFARAADAPTAPQPQPISAPPTTTEAPRPADPTVTTFHPDDPFPGTGKSAGETEVADVPKWVYDARGHNLPQARTVTVDPATGGPASIEDALGQLPATGGIIELRGRGPHRITGPVATDGRDVVIRAVAGETPVVHLIHAPLASGFSARGGRLELDGVHLVASGRGRDATQPLIRAESATVVIRNGTITLSDPADAAVAAVQLERGVGTPARCVLENVIVRGNNLTAVATLGGANEIVAGNCLLAGGNAPVFVFRDPLAIGQDASAGQAGLQLLSSIVLSRNAAIECEHRDATAVPSLYLRVRRTALLGAGPEAATLRFTNWPESSPNELDRPRALGVKLVCERTVWAGWPHLTAFSGSSGGAGTLADSDAQWLQFWRTPLEAGSTNLAQPVTTEPDHSRLDPAAVVAAVSAVATSSGGGGAEPPTIDLTRWPEAPQSLITRIAAGSARPRTPDDLDAAFSGPTVTIDLAKFGIKLNQKLNDECPDGARVVLTGRKRALIEPVVLKGKSLRIEFDGGGETLQIEPATRAGNRPPALFRVEGGRLDLVNARLRIPGSESASHPLRLLQVVDGSFAVRNCILIGQFGAGAQELPVIEWSPGAADVERFGLVENSLVAGRSQVIGAQLQGQLLEVRNSILVSAGEGLRISSAAAGRAATVHVAQSTVSAAETYFRLEPPPEPATVGPLQVFVGETVYYPAMTDSSGAVLLVENSNGGPQLPVEWWEGRTAISDRIARFRVPDAARTAPQNLDEVWERGWGPDHVEDLVTGPLSVIPTAQKVDLPKAQPGDFRLGDKSLAATASVDGGALGADVDAIGPREVKADAPKKSATPPQTPRPRGQPDF